ncbi:MAG: mreC, partial [Ignavibacteriaceae bacterium]|nr:mreC [Ignavibacteriaceae bacterium]
MLRFISSVWGNFKEYLVLVLLLVIGFISLSLNQNPAIKKVRAIAFGSFAASTAIFSDIFNIAKVKGENDRLREINAELMLQVNKLREYGVVNENLRKQIGIKDTMKYPLIPALTVSKSFTIAQGTITLNAGSDKGVKPGMPVINEKGLVGIIYATSQDYSIARTLKNFELKLVVKNERSRVDGVLKWNGEDLVIVNVPKTYDIEPGDRIVCSELSSIVSLPIPIGIVVGLQNIQTGI